MKKPHVKDYGGDCYVRGRRHRTEFGKTQTFRCLDCGTMRHVQRLERNRAARPRCLKCGGPLEMTVEQQKRTLGTEHQIRKSREQLRETISASAKSPMCLGCGMRFNSLRFVVGHLLRESECFRETATKTISRYVCGTAFVERGSKAARRFILYALTTNRLVWRASFYRLRDAEEVAALINDGKSVDVYGKRELENGIELSTWQE